MFDYNNDSKNAAIILDGYDFTTLLNKIKSNSVLSNAKTSKGQCAYVYIYNIYNEVNNEYKDNNIVLNAIKTLTKDELCTYLFNKYNVRVTEDNI